MNLISVDFISLEMQIQRLENYLSFLEETYDKIQIVLKSIDYMELGEIEDELRRVVYNFQDIIDDTVIHITKLKKICELYDECENSILSSVIDLPLDMPMRSNAPNNHKTGGILNHNIDIFSGHSVINEEWLDKLIFG